MTVAIFSTHAFEKETLRKALAPAHELRLLAPALTADTAALAAGSEAVCLFVNDDASAPVLKQLAALGVRYLVLRSAGFNNVDLEIAKACGLRVARVPAYSPYAVAEHTVALLLGLNRKLVKAHNRIREGNFSLDGLIGFDLHGKTAGIVGTGKIGQLVAQILRGFGCHVLAFDPAPDTGWATAHGVRYVPLEELFASSDIISLHAPLTPQTHYLVRAETLALMKRGVMLINTSRGALMHTRDAIAALKTGQLGYLGLDVYEEERGLFFEDHSEEILQDDVIARLTTFPNVLITSHQV
ncbi:2-hydroxyacid dehydrogenase [Flaviaesturariibacter aridisoli]|uniref:2-hydroxyacid dehydrogenase n=1 Tax=Flaviaesturariibacter aridisoli TaxID=2545761 RepID=A0A4R4DZU8_9BACT|nr:2-hydroxyacid dehydrogenase [Flaviaesturariibacter aridisoli]TCZ72279.1 2-hydroxyacid dehydrogenase [Flaviaesturariibacter aridisoli]